MSGGQREREGGKEGGIQKEYKRDQARPGSSAHNSFNIRTAAHCVAVATTIVTGQEVKEFTSPFISIQAPSSPTMKSQNPTKRTAASV